MSSGILGKLADKFNWSDKKRSRINMLFDVACLIILFAIFIKASECTCVSGTVQIDIYNDCMRDCMRETNNQPLCSNKCLSRFNVTSNISDYLPFT